MIKIAICDDVRMYIDQVHNIVDRYQWGEDIEVVEYMDGLDMIVDIFNQDEQLFDLIITDIEFTKNKEINAVDLFKKIQIRYPDIRIIYITIYDQYVMDVANSLPFGYARKPLKECEIFKLFDRYKRIERSKAIMAPSFVCRYKGEIIKIPYGRIKYVYSKQKKIYIVCNDGIEIGVRTKLDDAWEEDFSRLEYFARANKSYIINLFHAESFFPKDVKLDDGTMISISRGYLEDFRERRKSFLFWDRD